MRAPAATGRRSSQAGNLGRRDDSLCFGAREEAWEMMRRDGAGGKMLPADMQKDLDVLRRLRLVNGAVLPAVNQEGEQWLKQDALTAASRPVQRKTSKRRRHASQSPGR